MTEVVDISATRVLRPRALKYLLFALGSLALALFGLLLAMANFWYGWLMLGFGGFVALASLMMTSGRFAALALTADDFSMRSGFVRRRWRWDEVTEFFISYVNESAAVAFNYEDRSSLSSLREKIADARGFDEYLPETYRMKPKELMALMNAWRETAMR